MATHRRFTDRQVEDAIAAAVRIGNIYQAAEELHISEATLRYWLRGRGYRTRDGQIYRSGTLT